MVERQTGPIDVRERPTYAVKEAAAFIGERYSTLQAWCVGQRAHGRVVFRPVLDIALRRPPTLSFWNIVEAYVLSSIRRRHGVAMQRVRRALRYVGERQGRRRPLLHEDFLTDGVDLFVERYASLINASRDGQVALGDTIRASLQRVDRDHERLVQRLYPWRRDAGEPRAVVLDPERSFGRLTLAGTKIPVEIVAGRFRAGDAIDLLVREFSLTTEQVEAAIRWDPSATAA